MKDPRIWIMMFLMILMAYYVHLYLPTKTVVQCPKDQDIQALVRQTARWAVASQQDSSPMIALLHANYAAGYLQALELIATEDEINRTTDLRVLRSKIYGTQDRAARMVVGTCPQYMGQDVDKELARLGIHTR